MATTMTTLPRLTHKFLRTEAGQEADIVVHRFHCWMDAKGLTLQTLTLKLVFSYLRAKLRVDEAKATGYDFKDHLRIYLSWLYAKHRLPFDPEHLKAPLRRSLPETVERYLAELAVAQRPKSWPSVKSSLRGYHRWLHARNLTLRGFAREHAVEWLQSLIERKLHAATRRALLLDVRGYLRWLAEQGKIFRDPDELLRSSDQPKLPRYLPRPFPPKVDREIILRLTSAEDIESQGLLLMRQTGLRIGELRALPLDCTTVGEDGKSLLKVPLGKLNTERLVPLDDGTTRLIVALQRRGAEGRPWLLGNQRGSKVADYAKYQAALKRAAEGLPLAERATTHRLRHTYATTLLNAGMSLVGVMKLLGHADYRMTLRYAAVLPETVGHEYFKALGQIEKKYRNLTETDTTCADSSEQMLTDVICWLSGVKSAQPSEAKHITSLMRRLDTIKSEVERITMERRDK